MSSPDQTTTVGELVTENPQLMPVFENAGIDYCCGGHLSLDEACEASGLDPDTIGKLITETLERTSDEPEPNSDWTKLGLAELVDEIEQTHHKYLTAELPRLAALADKVLEVHGAAHSELADVHQILGALIADMTPHLLKEERILFPIVRQIAAAAGATEFHCGSVGNPIRVMRYEHDQVGEMLASLRRITDGYTPPADACGSYTSLYEGLAVLETDTHLHIHKENNVLFPAAIEAETALAQISPM